MTKAEGQQVSDSATSERKCKDMHTSPQKIHHYTPHLGKTTSKLVADRFIQGATSLNKMTKSSPLQASRLLLGTPGKHSKFQEQTASVEVKSPVISLRNIAAVKKPTMLGGLQSPSLPSTAAQQKRSLYQLNTAKDLSNTTFQGRNRQQLEGLMLRKTSSVVALSKTKATGALREACEKAFKFDVESSKGTVTRPITHPPSTGFEKIESVEARDDEVF